VLTVHPGDRPPDRQIRKLLVATDFSAQSEWALAASIELLNGADSNPPEVVLLHVYHVPYEFSMDSIYGPAAPDASVWAAVAREVSDRLERHAQSIATRLGVTVEPLSQGGYPPQVIVQQAALAGVDWIALGTHGRTGLAHVLLGSTAERVIQQAHCPVLTVRHSIDEPAPVDIERR